MNVNPSSLIGITKLFIMLSYTVFGISLPGLDKFLASMVDIGGRNTVALNSALLNLFMCFLLELSDVLVMSITQSFCSLDNCDVSLSSFWLTN